MAGKLAKCASLARSLRSKHSTRIRANGLQEAELRKSRGSEGQTREATSPKQRQLPLKAGAGADAIRASRKRRAGEMGHTAVEIHEDDHTTMDDKEDRAGKMTTRGPVVKQEDILEDEVSSQATESEDEIDESVVEDMRRLEESFTGISQKYRLINRIGEGTFSTVYKAEMLPQHNDEVIENGAGGDISADAPPTKKRKLGPSSHTINKRRRPEFVALKKIYVTSSPHRILNELELLHELRNAPHICPLLTAFRHLDQVVAVLPYFRHLDFRLYYRDFIVNDMRSYFRSLFSGLAWVHKAGIMHRDIKPTNFLYDHSKRQGVLVDFGLAERQGTDYHPCLCTESRERRRERFTNSYGMKQLGMQEGAPAKGYPKNDTRPSRRANRAGTRGFRAPEVLFKCTSQTPKIDIWSAGVILLTLLAHRFPFFNSSDDVDAMIEMASIFGKKRMQAIAALHGQLFETTIETIGQTGFAFEKLITWASCRDNELLHPGEQQAVDLLKVLLELDPMKRVSAKEALQNEFFTAPVEDEVEREEREAREEEEAAARGQRG